MDRRAVSSAALGATDADRRRAICALASRPGSRLVLLGTAGGPTPKPNRFPSAYALVVGDDVYVDRCRQRRGAATGARRAGHQPGATRVRDPPPFRSQRRCRHDRAAGLGGESAGAADPVGAAADARADGRASATPRASTSRPAPTDEGRPDFDAMTLVKEIDGDGLLLDDGLVRVRCARNAHPPIRDSYAIRIDAPDRSYVFSGDTTYSETVVALAKGADVLVHEVMYLPALDALIASEPNAKTLREHLVASHSTPEQVGRVATEAGVQTLVLSHFVPGGPVVDDATWLAAVRPHFAGEIVVGQDLMTVP